MGNKESEESQSIHSKFLDSPKSFHLESPLYDEFDLTDTVLAKKIFDCISYDNTIDAYCIWCDKESVFDTDERISVIPYGAQSTFYAWMKSGDGFRRVVHSCGRDSGHKYYVYYLKMGKLFTKTGQWPSVADFQMPQAEKYRKILGSTQYKEFTRGIGLAAHGVGIGSFVYLRRIFENLIEESHIKAQEDEAFAEDEYVRARMDDKIKIVSEYLPEFLVENRSLYSILSRGIHELTEQECLQYFEAVKLGIEQILDEKIIQKEKGEKAAKAREAIQKVHDTIAA